MADGGEVVLHVDGRPPVDAVARLSADLRREGDALPVEVEGRRIRLRLPELRPPGAVVRISLRWDRGDGSYYGRLAPAR